ncbi:Electron transport protein HydN [Pelotomaculum schinkii]|uniref:Electron transport protein HydN n=1 Tax=Pelotomaculum schinkii TaxID=78350 RepID=A0A4Y7RG99_9FIRM|nr:Electron transport protein HydN [Pelotomaculum schinkii]
MKTEILITLEVGVLNIAKILKVKEMRRCIGCFSCMTSCAVVNRHNHSLAKSAIKIITSGGLSGSMAAVVCAGCTGVRACAEACPTGALADREGGGVTLLPERCTGCRKCVAACALGAVHFDSTTNKPIICKHCGVCTQFCTHGCLEMEEA